MIRILEVTGGLGLGGAETWLVHLARGIDRKRFALDFLVHGREMGPYQRELEDAGVRVLRCEHPRRPWRYAPRLRRLLREDGPFSVIHSHVHHFSGLVLAVARGCGVPVRIAHSHLDSSELERGAGVFRRAYLAGMRGAIARNATHRVAVSALAATDLFGARPATVLACGLDLSPFQVPVDAAHVRRELGLPGGALVVGHVGRFVEQKNHAYAVRVVAEMARRDPHVHALFVGEGPLRAAVAAQVREAGIEKRVVFAGARRDVPRLMLGAMDVLLLPSLCEGLPLVAVEAQAAGLRVVASDAVPPEAGQGPLLTRLPLSASIASWARHALEAARAPRSPPPSTAGWPSDLRTSLAAIEQLYSTAAGRA